MLFINFLCLLYLMVHSNGYILTKSIGNNGKINEISNATTTPDVTRYSRRFEQKFVAENNTIKRLDITPTKCLSQPDISSKITTVGITYKTTEHLNHKTPKRKLGSFWRRFKDKYKKNQPNQQQTRRQKRTNDKIYSRQREHGRIFQDENNQKKKKRQQSTVVAVKRDTNLRTTTQSHKSVRINIPSQVLIQSKHSTNYNQYGPVTKLDKKITNGEKTTIIADMTSKIESLKKKYKFNDYNGIPFTYYAYKLSPSKIITKPLNQEPVEEIYFFNTPQIEEVLNNIKKKTNERIAENDPYINDIITNSATETTFEYDLLRNNLQSTTSHQLIHNIVAINDVHNVAKKRMAHDSKKTALNNILLVDHTEVPQVVGRSVKEDALTLTHSVEDLMERGLKKLYKKLKNKVCCDSQKAFTDKNSTKVTKKYNIKTSPKTRMAKSTTPLPSTRNVTEKHTTATLTTSFTQKLTTARHAKSTQWHTTAERTDKKNDTTTSTKSSKEILTYNDYMMLTEYEEMLRKSHQRKMPNELTMKEKQNRHCRLNKRNPGISGDFQLNQEIYQNDDDSHIPDVFTDPEVSDSSMSKPVEEITYKTLSDQMSYNTYVNGYKYYLKFQKDLGHDKFSAMVKYQAHKHHKVDDIGKHILNKLPPIPPEYQINQRRKKRFFDDTDIDDQEMSTKTDDSWFKRHFYIFIDNGPPRKFHSSQSVTLKSPENGYLNPTKSKKNNIFNDDSAGLRLDSDGFNLNEDTTTEQITTTGSSKGVMYNNKTTTVRPTFNFSKGLSNGMSTTFSTKMPFNFIQKLFSIKCKTTKQEIRKTTARFGSGKRTKKAVIEETNTESDINRYDTDVIATPAKEIGGKNLKKNNSQKFGHVDINVLIPKGTSVVKLREINTKRSKLQKFLNKFHFNGPKSKRSSNYRCSRFNPIQKLKDLFKSNPDKKYLYDKPDFSPLNDDNFQSKSIEISLKELKSDKYNKTLSMKDIMMHVPDIPNKIPQHKDRYTEKVSKTTPVLFKLTTKYKKSTTDEVTFTKPNYTPYTTKLQKNTNNRSGMTESQMKVLLKTLPGKERYETLRVPFKTTCKPLSTTPATNKYFVSSHNFHKDLENIQYTLTKTKELFNDKKQSSTGQVNTYISLATSNDIGNHQTKVTPDAIAKFYAYATTETSQNFKESSRKNLSSTGYEASTSKHKNVNYFDELLARNRDILNIDNLPSSTSGNGLYNTRQNFTITRATKMVNDLHLLIDRNPSSTSFLPKASQSVYDIENGTMVTGVVYNNKAFLKNKNFVLKGESNFYQYKTIDLDSIAMPGKSESATMINSVFPTRHITRFINTDIPLPRDRSSVARDWVNKAKPFTRIPNNYEIRQTNTRPLLKVKLYPESNNSTKPFDLSWSSEDLYFLKGIKRDCTKGTPATDSTPVLLIDTALLSYDDEVVTVTEGLNLKNMFSRSSLKSAQINTLHNPMTKLNKRPQQTYRTPLPMEPKVFEKFLKEEGMDIKSLTAPLNFTNMLDTWKATLNSNTLTTSPLINYIKTKNKLLNRTVTNFDRNERSVENVNAYSQSHIFNLNNFGNNKLGIEPSILNTIVNDTFMSRMKTTSPNVAHKKKPKTEKAVDITIIDFSGNDATDLSPIAVMPSRLGKALNTDGSDFLIDSHEADDYNGLSIHNGLLYKSDISHHDQKSSKRKENNGIQKFGAKERSGEIVRRIGQHPKLYNYTSILKSAKFATRPISNAKREVRMPLQEETELSIRSSNIVPSMISNRKDTNSNALLLIGKVLSNGSLIHNAKSHDVRNRHYDALHDRGDIFPTIGYFNLKHNKIFDLDPDIASLDTLESNDKVYDAISDIKSVIHNITKPDSDCDDDTDSGSGYTSSKPHDSSMIQKVINGLLNNGQSAGDLGYINAILSNLEWLLKRHPSYPVRCLTTPMNSFSTGNPEMIYVKPVANFFHSQIYQERDSKRQPAVGVTLNRIDINDVSLNTKQMSSYPIHLNKKRDTNLQNKFTAKDVAALEVILDVMKNTLSYDDKDITSVSSNNFILRGFTKPMYKPQASNNSIQVHIAIPYNNQSERKRSPLEPVLVRKVFAVKMSKPVDLEYQVHSFEASPETTTISSPATEDGLSPGMYLLIYKSNDTYALQPVKTKMDFSHLKSRQAMTTRLVTQETTRHDEVKGMAKITLSKDSLTTINKPAAELYENPTNNYETRVRQKRHMYHGTPLHLNRKTRGNAGTKGLMNREHTFRKFRSWDKLKKCFGDDRTCYCKCKPNQPMCRACAASDAVINELIFEFGNIAQYMKEHCTELQTYFLMNPNGGLQLRDTVHNIDKSLHDYYKRVKGKCQGKTCKAFGTNPDKRQFIKKDKNVSNAQQMIEELNSAAGILNMTVKMSSRYNHKLIEDGREMLQTINNCVPLKFLKKRSNALTTKKKLIKNVYSLDNISVNIICSPGGDSLYNTTTNMIPMSDTTFYTSDPLELQNMSLDEFNWNENIDKPKKRKGLKYRKNKNKLFTYYTVDNMTFKPLLKRDTCNQNEIAPVSNDGDNFWNNHSQFKSSHKTQAVAPTKLQEAISNGIELFKSKFATRKKTENKNTTTINDEIKISEITRSDGMKKFDAKTCLKTVNITNATIIPKTIKTDYEFEPITEYLTDDINKLFQLFGSIKDIESANMHSNISQSNTETTIKMKMNKLNTVDSLIHVFKSKKVNTKPNSKNEFPGQRTTGKVSTNLQKKSPTNIKTTTALITKSTISTPIHTINTNIVTKKYSTVKNIRSPVKHSKASTFACETKNILTLITDTKVTEKNKIHLTTSAPRIGKSDIISNASNVNKNLDSEEHTDSTLITESHTKTRTEKRNRTSRKPGFIDQIRSVKSKLLGNTKSESTKVTTKPDQRSRTDNSLNNTKTTLVDQNGSNEASTAQIPTIIIINEHSNQLTGDILNRHRKNSEDSKNLLLSIIQFETDKLNDEWQTIAHSDNRESGQLDSEDYSLRSIQNDQTTPSTELYNDEEIMIEAQQTDNNVDMLQHLNNINIAELPVPEPSNQDVRTSEKTTKIPPGLLGEIIDKMNVNLYTRKMYENQQKANDSHQPNEIVCDLQATYHHVTQLHSKLDDDKFEKFVRNIPCYNYKRLPRSFFIIDKTDRMKWDWIRSKRSLNHRMRYKDDDKKQTYDFGDDVYDGKQHCRVFESYVRDEDGIYRVVTREKRKVDKSRSSVNLRSLTPVLPTVANEVFLMLGDSITLDCFPYEKPRSAYLPIQYTWETERGDMLKHENVQVDGPNVLIRDARPKNSGRYWCTVDDIVGRNVRVNLVTLPTIDLVFLPTYRLPRECTYNDLKAIQRVGQPMSEAISCGNMCSIRIDEPVCQREKTTNHSLIRSTAVLKVRPRRVRCSVQCRRDIHLSFVRLAASTLPALTCTKVTISRYGVNKTLTPCRGASNAIVTHTLRRKDSSDHRDYHKLSWTTDGDRAHVVLNCDAGYYLLRDTNVCAACPANTSSSLGENSCSRCPQGMSSTPGARECREKNKHHRRYDWWWWWWWAGAPCGHVVVASAVVLCACGACICFSLVVQLVSRATALRTDKQTADYTRPSARDIGKEEAVSSYYAHTDSGHRRPLSPSRVILARFFKPSLTSSRVTPVDSQETRFEHWKEKNIAPPLPPVDFDTDVS